MKSGKISPSLSERIDINFALRNALAWALFSAVLTVLNYTLHSRDLARELQANAGLAVCCIFGTHLVRMVIRGSGEDAPWKKIYFNAFVIAVPLFSFLMAVMGLELHWLFGNKSYLHEGTLSPKIIFHVWFFMCLLLSSWTGLYISTLAIKRSSKAEVERLRFETALRDAELRALKAQINPHFLFNSLNTIRALVNEHPERAQEAVLHLSLILRAALQTECLTRTLREEMETVRHYLELEKLRFEERLNIDIDIRGQALEAHLPTMLLQTLVENAIKHGIGKVIGGGALCIRGAIESGRLRVEITNPGRLDDEGDGMGLGLHNARTRLSRLFGPDATLTINDEEGTVRAVVTVPVKRYDQGTTC
jgi:hypothetical protein